MNNEINEFRDIISNRFWNKRDMVEKHLYLNVILYDEDTRLRRFIASNGLYHEVLQYDNNSNVRYYVALYTKDKTILEHLANDEDYNVKHHAKETLKEIYGK